MTTEQKAKAYDEAIERASKLRVQNPFDTVSQMMEHVFPELRESEDERIRKALIEYFNEQCDMSDWNGVYGYQVVDWLEKQGEHKKFRDSIQVGDEVTRNSDGVIVNLSQLKRVAKKSEQKLPIEKLPEKMKTIGESLGFTTQEECDEYNEMVTNLIMGDDDKGEQKTALSEEELTDFEKSLKHVMEETLECGDIHNLKADADLLLRLVKPTDDDMKEALRTEYEKGRADAFVQMQKHNDAIKPKFNVGDYIVSNSGLKYYITGIFKGYYMTESGCIITLDAQDNYKVYNNFWSKEEEELLNNICNLLQNPDSIKANQHVIGDIVDWLKSLKDRVKSQNTWKPSDGQMSALKIATHCPDLGLSRVLKTLYNDLDKLTKE